MAIHITATLHCPMHPRYMARREPTSGCDHCHALWVLVWNLVHKRLSTDYTIRHYKKVPQ